jgi:hypothetical protein
MAITMYHVLSNLEIYNLLQEELQNALPNASADASWSDLERLPYLVSIPNPAKWCIRQITRARLQ